jgi:uncharacterized membrane protein YhaH (DUF805 family)
MRWFLYCLRHYATFKGRASRAQYWWFTLVAIIGNIACIVAMAVSPLVGALIAFVYSAGLILPHCAVASRRLHDTGHSFWWFAPVAVGAILLDVFQEMKPHVESASLLVVGAVPLAFVGLFVLFLLCKRGDSSANKYGDSPPTTPG